jgi:hypothetical protein
MPAAGFGYQRRASVSIHVYYFGTNYLSLLLIFTRRVREEAHSSFTLEGAKSAKYKAKAPF